RRDQAQDQSQLGARLAARPPRAADPAQSADAGPDRERAQDAEGEAEQAQDERQARARALHERAGSRSPSSDAASEESKLTAKITASAPAREAPRSPATAMIAPPAPVPTARAIRIASCVDATAVVSEPAGAASMATIRIDWKKIPIPTPPNTQPAYASTRGAPARALAETATPAESTRQPPTTRRRCDVRVTRRDCHQAPKVQLTVSSVTTNPPSASDRPRTCVMRSGKKA